MSDTATNISPEGSNTVIYVLEAASGSTRTFDTSMPAAALRARISRPNTSPPTALTSRASSPRRAAFSRMLRVTPPTETRIVPGLESLRFTAARLLP